MIFAPTVCDADSLTPIDLYQGSCASDPDFFCLFDSAGVQGLINILDRLQKDSASDYCRPIVAQVEQAMIGFLYAYPLNEIFSRQAHSLRQFITLSNNPSTLRPALANLASGKGVILKKDSYYLSRIYVMPSVRRFGVGDLLMKKFECIAIDHGFSTLSLHVRVENIAAQRFYARLGFELSDKKANGYLSMEKEI